jgi:Na+-driven multidrug efflux pump
VTITVFISLGMIYTFFRGSILVRFFVDDQDVTATGRDFSGSSLFSGVFAIFTVITGGFPGRWRHEAVMILSIARLWCFGSPSPFCSPGPREWGLRGSGSPCSSRIRSSPPRDSSSSQPAMASQTYPDTI